jgi:hypothetical protein
MSCLINPTDPFQDGGFSWNGQNVSNNFVKIFNGLYLFSIDFAWCLTLGIFASLVNAFVLVHDSENPKFGSLNSRAVACTIIILIY